jgi:hypothetical protein
MKTKKDNSIVQINCINQIEIIAKNVDIHYCIEICNFLKELHPAFRYVYAKTEYIKNNKDNLNTLFAN